MKLHHVFSVTFLVLLLFSVPAIGSDGGPPVIPHGSGEAGPPPHPCKHPRCCEQGAPSWSVNMVNMNLYVSDIPLWYIQGPGPAVRPRLSYNSMSPVTGQEIFGNKWSFYHASFLTVDPDGNVTRNRGDGRKYVYPATENGYGHPYRNTTTLVKIDDHHFEVHYFSGKVETYDHYAAGTGRIMLSSIADAHSLLLTLGYDGQDRLSTLTDAQGRVTTLEYNADNLVRRLEGPFGRAATFTYREIRREIRGHNTKKLKTATIQKSVSALRTTSFWLLDVSSGIQGKFLAPQRFAWGFC